MLKTLANSKIDDLTLVSSCSCNLQCAYCVLSHNILNYQYAKKLLENTIKAFLDGSFLQTSIDALKRFNSTPEDIKMFEFWGQEPTLTLKYFTEHIEDWLTTYPNIADFIFSTNGMANVDDIIDYIKAIDKFIGHDVLVAVLFSYDGEWPTKNLRGGNPELIKSNYKKLLNTFCNEVSLNYVKFAPALHNVISFDLLHYLDNTNSVDDFEKELRDFWFECEDLVRDRKFLNNRIEFTHGCGLETPVKASKADGEFLADFLRKYELTHPYSYSNPDSIASQLYFFVISNFVKNSELKNVYDNIKESYKDLLYNLNEARDALNNMFYCGSFLSGLKVMYDGTILTCQSFLFDTTLENIQTSTDLVDKSIKEQLVKHNFHPNVYTNTDSDIEKVLDVHFTGKRSCSMLLLQECMTLVYNMGYCGLVDTSYIFNDEKLLRHAIILATRGVCLYNTLMMTGSYYLRETGHIRLYCNGLLDLAEKFYLEHREAYTPYNKLEEARR